MEGWKEGEEVIKMSTGQKSKLAIISLVLGIFSFIHLFGLEKAALAVIFGFLALNEISNQPEMKGKSYAWVGIILGTLSLVLTITLLSIKFPELKQFIEKMK